MIGPKLPFPRGGPISGHGRDSWGAKIICATSPFTPLDTWCILHVNDDNLRPRQTYEQNLTSFRSGVAEQTVYCPSTLDKIFIYRQMFSSWRMLVYNRKCQRIVVQAKFKSWNFPWFSPPPNLQLLSLCAGGSAEPIGFCWFVASHFWRICLFMLWLQKRPQTVM